MKGKVFSPISQYTDIVKPTNENPEEQPTSDQGFSQDLKSASPHNFLRHKNNAVDKFHRLEK